MEKSKNRKEKRERKNKFFGINKHLSHVQSCCKKNDNLVKMRKGRR